MTNVPEQKQWMVRKSNGGITMLGPFWTDQVRLMVEQGMLDADDELCPENSYWFALHEVAEVKRTLGIDNVPLRKSAQDEESTQPDLDVSDVETDPELNSPSFDPESTGMIKIKRPAAAKTPTAAPVSATELASRFKRVSTAHYLGYAGAQGQPRLRLEKSRFWGILFIVCVLLAGLGVVWVLKSLKV